MTVAERCLYTLEEEKWHQSTHRGLQILKMFFYIFIPSSWVNNSQLRLRTPKPTK